MDYYDVIVIGGGLLGCFAVRSLTRYDLKIMLLEKREDLCTGISRANTAIVYSGCDTKPGTLKASMCVRAAQNFTELCCELGVRYSRCGSVMICFGERGAEVLRKKLRDGIENGVQGVRLLTREEVLELEPNIAENVHSGLYVPDTGTVMPWELCLAAAGNAVKNGAEVLLNTEVMEISRREVGSGNFESEVDRRERQAGKPFGYEVRTNRGTFYSRGIVNCAGMDADKILEMTSKPVVRIIPTAGEYYVLDTKAAVHIRHVIFHEPEEKGKGLTLVPTVDGNILVGPTERPIADCAEVPVDKGNAVKSGGGISAPDTPNTQEDERIDGYTTARKGLELLKKLASEVVPTLSLEHIIRSFGTIRPNPYLARWSNDEGWVTDGKSINDFCISESEDGMVVSFAGVKTPGLTCAGELGAYAAEKMAARLGASLNTDFDPRYVPPLRLDVMPYYERKTLVCSNPKYGEIVCRCRGISEGEIIDAIHRVPGAVTPDGVKRRTGAGSGRCQGSFCGQRVGELIAAEKPEYAAGELSIEVEVGRTERKKAGVTKRCTPDYDIVVIGGGPAGMAAALGSVSASQDLSAGSRKRSEGSGVSGTEDGRSDSVIIDDQEAWTPPSVLIIERGPELGGILNQCTHTGFGLTYFKKDLTGQEYARRFGEMIGSSPVAVMTGTTVLDIGADGSLTVSGKKTGLAHIRAKAVVLAAGCRERPIGALPIAGTRPAGVYAAGAAQKMINLGGYDLGKRFVILGSGDVGLIVARELAMRGKEVVAVIEKEDRCGGLERNRVNCLEKFGIPLITRTTVSEVHGVGRISGVTVCAVQRATANSASDLQCSSSSFQFIKCDALITSVGLIPERELLDRFAGKLPDWLFLCGNVCFVHDAVDDVTVESQRAGRLAAMYAAGAGSRNTTAGAGSGLTRPDQMQSPAFSRPGGLSRGTEAGSTDSKICVACPKSCAVVRTADGWQGLACGRNEPELQ